MPTTQPSKLKYMAKYKSANIIKVSIEFNKNKNDDMVLLDHLKTKSSKQAYIKNLISEDMKK